MLDLIRRKQQSVLIKFVFWGIIATFVGTIFLVWGKGDDRSGATAGSVAATVNDTTIEVQAFQQAYQNLYQFYQNLYRERFNAEMEKQLGLEQTAIDQLIRQALLEQEADRLDIEVSKQEVIDEIAKIPAFQVDGRFDRNTYLQVLQYQRISSEEFEISQQRALIAEKVEEQIMSAVSVSDSDIEAEFKKQNEKVNLTYVRLAPSSFESKVKVSDSDLKEYFDLNKEQFRIPTKVAIRYLQFEPGRYEKEVELSDEAIQKYYERNIAQFSIEEQVSAAHILIKVDQDADAELRAKKKELAEKILEMAKKGDDFGKLARKYSDDTASAVKNGALGYFTRGTMVPAFEQAAFALKPGDISDIVVSQFGLHIIKADGYIEPGEKPLDEVIDTVKDGLKKQLSVQLALEKAMDAYNINRKSGDLEKAASETGLGIKESGLFDRDMAIDGIGKVPAVISTAFSIEPGTLARPIRTETGIYLIALKEKQESRLPELEEVKKEVEAAYRKTESGNLARAAAEELLAGLKEGKKLASLAKKSGAKVEETGLFSASYGAFVPRLGNAEELANSAFDLTAENSVAPQVYELAGRYVVATLKEKQAADMSQLTDEKKAELRESVNSSKRRELLEARIEELKKEATIQYSTYLQSRLGKV